MRSGARPITLPRSRQTGRSRPCQRATQPAERPAQEQSADRTSTSAGTAGRWRSSPGVSRPKRDDQGPRACWGPSCHLSTVNCQRPIVSCQRSAANCQMSIVQCQHGPPTASLSRHEPCAQGQKGASVDLARSRVSQTPTVRLPNCPAANMSADGLQYSSIWRTVPAQLRGRAEPALVSLVWLYRT